MWRNTDFRNRFRRPLHEAGKRKGMDVSYNTQVVTEAESKMIVDYKTTNNGSDKGQLTEMGKTAKEFLEVDKITGTRRYRVS